MELNGIQSASLIVPMAATIMIMSGGNFADGTRPILSSARAWIYRATALFLGIAGLLGAFGAFNYLVENFDRMWGTYVFCSVFLNLYLHNVRNKYASTTVANRDSEL